MQRAKTLFEAADVLESIGSGATAQEVRKLAQQLAYEEVVKLRVLINRAMSDLDALTKDHQNVAKHGQQVKWSMQILNTMSAGFSSMPEWDSLKAIERCQEMLDVLKSEISIYTVVA